MSYASSWILLQLIIIPQPQPHYGFLALNKHRRMVFEEKVRVGFWKRIVAHIHLLMTVKRKHVTVKHMSYKNSSETILIRTDDSQTKGVSSVE